MPDNPVPSPRRGVIHIYPLPKLGPWVDDALCATEDPDLFFGDALTDREAVKVCRRCPVVEACLEDALRTERGRDRWGVRGGLTADERRALRKAHRRVVA